MNKAEVIQQLSRQKSYGQPVRAVLGMPRAQFKSVVDDFLEAGSRSMMEEVWPLDQSYVATSFFVGQSSITEVILFRKRETGEGYFAGCLFWGTDWWLFYSDSVEPFCSFS